MTMAIPEGFHDRRADGDTTLRQCQLVQLHLLYVLDAICKELNLTYFLGGGSALGAARHNGFIPWDDDLDVGMPMKDYKQFLKRAREFLPKDVALQTQKDTPRTHVAFAKLRDLRSFYFEAAPDFVTTDPNGIYLDIFPYEEFPNVPLVVQKFLVQACASSWARKQWLYNQTRKSLLHAWFCSTLAETCGFVHVLVRGLISFLRLFIPCKHTFIFCEGGYYHRYETSWIYPTEKHIFEDGEFAVPGRLDEYLTSQYGDWHWIPPPEKRPRHAKIIDPFRTADAAAITFRDEVDVSI